MGGRSEKVRGVYRFSSLVKQNKKAKICFVIYIAGERKIFFYICDVITSPEKEKALLITTSQVHVCARAAEFVATSHVDDNVPNSLQLEVLDQEICLLQSRLCGTCLRSVLYPALVNSL